jgi:hypothetical protein
MQNARWKTGRGATRFAVSHLALYALHFAGCLALAAFSGCGWRGHGTAGPSEDRPKAARSEVDRGPVRLSVAVEPSPMRLSDEPKLTLQIDYARGVTVRNPEFGSALGEFVIRDFRESLPRVEGDRQILQRVYTLEPTRVGKVTIDPITVHFTDGGPGGAGKEQTIQSEPITVEVAAVAANEVPSLTELRGPADPLPLPRPSAGSTWWIAALAAAAVVGAGTVWWRRRRKSERTAPALSAAELAYLELQQLLSDPQAREDVKRFYLELTGIVRRYIERTTGIRAPEQTTQEFLHEIGRRPDFPAEEAGRLRSFLEAADLVKFAAHQPRSEDVEESFRRAKAFVGCAAGEGVAA